MTDHLPSFSFLFSCLAYSRRCFLHLFSPMSTWMLGDETKASWRHWCAEYKIQSDTHILTTGWGICGMSSWFNSDFVEWIKFVLLLLTTLIITLPRFVLWEKTKRFQRREKVLFVHTPLIHLFIMGKKEKKIKRGKKRGGNQKIRNQMQYQNNQAILTQKVSFCWCYLKFSCGVSIDELTCQPRPEHLAKQGCSITYSYINSDTTLDKKRDRKEALNSTEGKNQCQ